MSNNKDSTSSSDDDVSISDLREACDVNFLPESLFSNTNSTNSSEIEIPKVKEAKPSLRVTEYSDKFQSFGVSQNFKDYVAKKLDHMLERQIEVADSSDTEEKVSKKKKKRKKHVKPEAGIKLLSSSEQLMIAAEEPQNEKQVQTKRFKTTKEDEAIDRQKCKEAAVDPEWILSKTETKSWNERQKGEVFKYKKQGCSSKKIVLQSLEVSHTA